MSDGPDTLFPCCEHCRCPEGDRLGHHIPCSLGCNDGPAPQARAESSMMADEPPAAT